MRTYSVSDLLAPFAAITKQGLIAKHSNRSLLAFERPTIFKKETKAPLIFLLVPDLSRKRAIAYREGKLKSR